MPRGVGIIDGLYAQGVGVIEGVNAREKEILRECMLGRLNF